MPSDRKINRCPKAILGAALALCSPLTVAAQEERDPGQPQRSAESLVAQARKALDALGYTVPDAVKLEVRSPRQVREDFDALQDEGQVLSLFWLFRAMRQSRVLNAKALRTAIVIGTARGLSAYYHPPRKAFVMLDTPSRELSEAVTGSLLPLISHELVHAHQDTRKGGILGGFRSAQTSDRLSAFRCVIEGEAELIAIASLKGIEHLDTLKTGDLDRGDLESSLVGFATARIYGAGRAFALTRYQKQGVDGLRAAFTQPPSSTEQILHLAKLGRDAPREVELPDVRQLDGRDEEYEVVCTNTFGELQIHSVLLTLGRLDRKTAALAAIGWDGDRIAVLRAKGKTRPTAAIWRTVWDRDVDARQFQKALDAARSRNTYTDRQGRCVDCVISSVADMRRALGARLSSSPWRGDVDVADGESTAAAEAQALVRLTDSVVVGGFWKIGVAGLRIPIPEGWTLTTPTAGGVDALRAPQAKGSNFVANINVQVLPNGGTNDLEKHLELNRTQLARLQSLKVESLEIVKLGKRDVILGEYHGTLPGSRIETHHLVTIYMRGRKQIVVTASVASGDWDTWSKQLRETFGAMQIVDPQ